jgi:UDP-2,3-diacylglucosamine pyrophosphatase LpxH
MNKRHIDVLVISDVHLGTAACRAVELNAYLKSVEPAMVVLNGDIFDLWDFRKGFWPETHTKVIRRLLKFAAQGVPVHYVTGNHDGALRRYSALALGTINLVDRLELILDGRSHWFLHGDVFDHALGTSRLGGWIGTVGYNLAVSLDVGLKTVLHRVGMHPVSLAEMCKSKVPAARRHIARYEECCLRAAAARGHDAVVVGHIHVPCQRSELVDGCQVTYLNSGDWVDSLSALEYAEGAWRVVTWSGLVAAGQVAAPQLDETAALAPVVARCA